MLLRNISLTTSYIIALSILIIWSTFAFFTMHTLISSQEIYGKLINLSGKQRMLSQKIALQSHLIMEHQSDIKKLESLLESMRKEYNFIKNNLTSADLNDFYFKQNGLDEQVELFFRLVENFINKPNFDDSKNITEFSFELLEPLHDAVFMFEKENQDIVKNLKNRESYIYIGTILTLILEAIFIIFPMIRSHTSYIEKLEDEIIKRTKDIQIFAKIFENSKEGIIITDARKTILNVNDAFVNITGFFKRRNDRRNAFYFKL